MEFLEYFFATYGTWLFVSVEAVILTIVLRKEIRRTRRLKVADKNIRVFWGADAPCPPQLRHRLRVSMGLQRSLAEAGQDANDTIYIGSQSDLKQTTFADFLKRSRSFI